MVGREDVFGGVHSDGDVDGNGMAMVVCLRSAFKICGVGYLFGGVMVHVSTGVVLCCVSS